MDENALFVSWGTTYKNVITTTVASFDTMFLNLSQHVGELNSDPSKRAGQMQPLIDAVTKVYSDALNTAIAQTAKDVATFDWGDPVRPRANMENICDAIGQFARLFIADGMSSTFTILQQEAGDPNEDMTQVLAHAQDNLNTRAEFATRNTDDMVRVSSN